MSGVVAIAHSDGRPLNRELLLEMTRSLAFRGLHAQLIWMDHCVGLGHAAQTTPGDSTRSSGIATLGTGTWIAADIRLDARKELIAALRGRGQDVHPCCNDSQLLLHAYEIWREECLQHVIGDFAFILWDQSRQQLFCAGDHFGVRRLYFAQLGDVFLCGNTLDCLKLHPRISARLNDLAIADFLLFGVNQEEATTTFADIQRLPRGHFLRWSSEGSHIAEYWRPPTNCEIRYKKNTEYIEHFAELLGKAVEDRTQGKKIGVLLSGGLDSSSVAAFCAEEKEKRPPLELYAFTVTTRNLDQDGQAATIVARALSIPLHYIFDDELIPFEGWDSAQWPEPVEDPFAGGLWQEFAEISAHTPVVLSGEGSDNLMEFEPWVHLRNLWRGGRRRAAAAELARHAVMRFRAPDGIYGPLRRMSRAISRNESKESFPEWLNPNFVERVDLKARWFDPTPNLPWKAHPQHPRGYGSLFFPQWTSMFEAEDPAFTKSAVEVRYPFLDLRIISYLLAVPAMPWFFRKFLLREAIRGKLPENIRKRPKRPLQEDHLSEASRHGCDLRLSRENLCKEISEYVDVESLMRNSETKWNSTKLLALVRPWCLSFWLKYEETRHFDIMTAAALSKL